MSLSSVLDGCVEIADRLQMFAVEIDRDGGLSDAHPADLVQAMGTLGALLQVGHQIEAALCHRLTEIAADAAGQ